MFRIAAALSASLLSLCLASHAAEAQPNVFFAIEPGVRTQTVGDVRTAILAVVNAGDETAENCAFVTSPSPITSLDYFEITISGGAITGTGPQNSPFDVPAGETRYAAIALNITSDFQAHGIPISTRQSLACDNFVGQGVAGISRLLLSQVPANSADVVSSLAAVSGDGVIRIASNGGVQRAGAAMVNIGSGGAAESITVRPEFRRSAFSGVPFALRGAPFELQICETNPSTGQCLAPPSDTVTVSLDGNPRTASIVVRDHAGYAARLAPDTSRIALTFLDSNDYVVGRSSLAYTSPGPAPDPQTASIADYAGIYTFRTTGNDGEQYNGSRDYSDGYIVVDPDGSVWLSGYYTSGVLVPTPGRQSLTTRQFALGQAQLGAVSDGTQAWSIAFDGWTKENIGHQNSTEFSALLSGRVARGYTLGSLTVTAGDTSNSSLQAWPLPAGFRAEFDAISLQTVDFPSLAGEYAAPETLRDPEAANRYQILVDAQGTVSGFFQYFVDNPPTNPERCDYTGTLSLADPALNVIRFSGQITGCSLAGPATGVGISSPGVTIFASTGSGFEQVDSDQLTLLLRNTQSRMAFDFPAVREITSN